MHTPEQLAAIAEMKSTFEKRLERLTLELTAMDDVGGYVFCWDRYALGSAIVNGKPKVVGIEDAMIVNKNDRRVFTNGGRERAVLMTRKKALEAALTSVGASYDHLIAMLAKQEEHA
jgi:hypothetical protein